MRSPPPPYVPLDGVQAVIDKALKEAPIAQVKEAALMTDNRPLQAVEASGFVAAMLADYPRQYGGAQRGRSRRRRVGGGPAAALRTTGAAQG